MPSCQQQNKQKQLDHKWKLYMHGQYSNQMTIGTYYWLKSRNIESNKDWISTPVMLFAFSTKCGNDIQFVKLHWVDISIYT